MVRVTGGWVSLGGGKVGGGIVRWASGGWGAGMIG